MDIGCAARITQQFHQDREQNRSNFSSRWGPAGMSATHLYEFTIHFKKNVNWAIHDLKNSNIAKDSRFIKKVSIQIIEICPKTSKWYYYYYYYYSES